MGMKAISKKGELLTLDHEEATEIINGKPVLAKGVAKDLEDLVAQERLEGELVVAKPLGFERFAIWVTRLSFLFIMLGIAGAYMEMQSPGFGIPGAVSLISFAIFFFGYYMAGHLAGFEMIAVFLLGLVLIGLEALLFPGTLIFAMAGAILMFAALIYTMAGTSIGGGAFSIDVRGIGAAVRNLAIGLGGAVILVALMLRFLPGTRALSWLILQRSVPEGPSLDAAGAGAMARGADAGEEGGGRSGGASLVGMTGVTVTRLHPTGKGRFGGATLDIVSDAEFVESGVDVKIVAHEGSRIVVARV
jgi:membrane-bound serine protease (ClpP class)